MRANMLATTVAVSLIATTAAVSAAQLNLTQQQKQTIEQNLSSQKAENMPSGFTLKEGLRSRNPSLCSRSQAI